VSKEQKGPGSIKWLCPARLRAHEQPCALAADSTAAPRGSPAHQLARTTLRAVHHKTSHRTGTLWDSRYTSSPVQEDTYLLLCQRYIELNPVRAARVDDPAHYRWSSYPANALGQCDPRITPHPLYTALAVDEASAAAGHYFATRSTPKPRGVSVWH
jgi:hypothetical protein